MHLGSLAQGMALGATAMYLLDPDRGHRRRAMISQAALREVEKGREAASVMARDASNRATGVKSRLGSRLMPDDADDEKISQRVRSALGHVCTHPGAIKVDTNEGVVWLRGDVFASELKGVLRAARRARGVQSVRNELTVHQTARGVSSLQGGAPLASGRISPTGSLMISVLGFTIATVGLLRRDQGGAMLSLAGVSMIAKAFVDVEKRFSPRRDVRDEDQADDEELRAPDEELVPVI